MMSLALPFTSQTYTSKALESHTSSVPASWFEPRISLREPHWPMAPSAPRRPSGSPVTESVTRSAGRLKSGYLKVSVRVMLALNSGEQ